MEIFCLLLLQKLHSCVEFHLISGKRPLTFTETKSLPNNVIWRGMLVKISAKKVVIIISSGKKLMLPFLGLPGKLLEKSRSGPPGKNPSDAHDCSILVRWGSMLVSHRVVNLFDWILRPQADFDDKHIVMTSWLLLLFCASAQWCTDKIKRFVTYDLIRSVSKGMLVAKSKWNNNFVLRRVIFRWSEYRYGLKFSGEQSSLTRTYFVFQFSIETWSRSNAKSIFKGRRCKSST